MAGPKVSICIPAYEQVVYLERTLASTLEQDFQDIEVILTDDSTSNAVQDLVERYRPRFSCPFTYIRNRPALGSPANWNAAIERATGVYIKIMHHDEWFTDSTSLRRFVEAIEHGADFAFSSVVTHVEKDGRSWELHPSDAEVAELLRVPGTILLANLIGPPSATIHRRLPDARYDTRFLYVVDMAFYMRFLRGGRVVRIADPLIQAVSDAAHNVTNIARTRDIELREFIVLFAEIRAQLPRSVMPRFARKFFWLFVDYRIGSAAALRSILPAIKIDPFFRRILWKVKLHSWRDRLLGRTR